MKTDSQETIDDYKYDLKLCEDDVLEQIKDGTHDKFFPIDKDLSRFL